MNRHLVRSVSLVVLGLVVSCSGRSLDSATRDRDRTGSAIVVHGQELRAGGGNLLSALAARVTSMRIHRGGGRCPEVALRGTRTLTRGGTAPLVYVDRSRFSDTCILDQLRVREIQRVEIYPGGSTSRPGYTSHPHGLILVFLTTKADAPN